MKPAVAVAVDDMAKPAPAAAALRSALRMATQPVHMRLHSHPGLAAVQNGTIDRASYRALLSRLYGFHTAFETAGEIEPERSRWLAADLGALGLTEQAIADLPRCPFVPRLDTPHRRLGALYVAEGSTLGGRELAKRLDGLFGAGNLAGRAFFSGRAVDTGKAWRAFLVRLELPANDDAASADVIDAAQETFAAFEEWLVDWNVATDVQG
jgi:heme oxygenase (biliverdin-IX-beta and delta-forming)